MTTITELHIKNLALIEDQSVAFDDGFSVFTGETGAGKSILVGAIGLLLGERASSEMVRAGREEAEISGVFDCRDASGPLAGRIREFGLDPENEGALIVRRTIGRLGKNKVYINQIPVPLTTLKNIGDALIDFHGQHEHQALLQPEEARIVVDGLAAVAPVKERYSAAYGAHQAAASALDAHDSAMTALSARRDMLEFGYQELAACKLEPGEEAKLEEEIKLLSTTSERREAVAEINALLSEEPKPLTSGSAIIIKRLEFLSRLDPSVEPWIADIKTAATTFTELERFCGVYLEDNGLADPGRLDICNSRLAKIQRLKKKYQCSGDELIACRDKIKGELDALQNSAVDRSALAKQAEEAKAACVALGLKLRAARTAAAARFDKQVSEVMQRLGFTGGLLQTFLHETEEPSEQGLETLEFLVRTNPGEPVLPLIKIASGGEISRLMLAIKTVLAGAEGVPILIFDEIDSGIGGLLANDVGAALLALAATHQVLCISHLHQIATRAHHHFKVFKQTEGERTVTRVEKLSRPQQVAEVARMMGGESDISKKFAAELLRGKNG
ncbi:MAG: DNA repair protein RecN [Chitinivibrionales bacterium]|nr:DNA repair protein RecN [Chitinivibrionales bacterium]